MKTKKEDNAQGIGIVNKIDSASSHVGNKVLPITDAAPSSASNSDQICQNSEKKEKTKGDKMKTISRMKELLKWAAAVKAEKGGRYIGRKVLHFRNKSAMLKASVDEDEMSNESPKISFRWDVESCSTTSSVYSAISAAASMLRNNGASVNTTPLRLRDHSAARPGNWITTDSEFVVLEL